MSDASTARERRAAHIALRVLIERAFGAAGRGVAYAVSPKGKLSLPGLSGGFSLSHIPGWALIGLAPREPIGVDLERRRPITMSADRQGAIERAAEILAVQTLPVEPEARFLQAWVRLEAVSKAEGTGLGPLLTRLGITRSGLGTNAPAGFDRYTVYDLDAGEGRFAAVALGAGEQLPRLHFFPATPEKIEVLARR